MYHSTNPVKVWSIFGATIFDQYIDKPDIAVQPTGLAEDTNLPLSPLLLYT